MHVGLRPGRAQPAAMIGDEMDDPAHECEESEKADEQRDAFGHVHHPPNRPRARVLRRVGEVGRAQIEGRVPRDVGMLREKPRQPGVRVQITFARQERRVQTQDLPERGRVIPQ